MMNKYFEVTTQAWINNCMPSKVWDEIINPFTDFNGATIEV